MSKKQAEEIARQYVNAHKKHFGSADPEAIENAVQLVATALKGLSTAK